ncbi:MAG: anti-sigma regulatory factor [Planctomycetes bacterium]|nr:anti-sigma regulatory factor [Planctomycetota bacterium]
MNAFTYIIAGGDYIRAGAASRRLKERLEAAGAAPDSVRRAVIAACEAEMNVVVHARGGRMEARLAPGRIDVEVADAGPGIADVPLAMQEGYSTAPPEARALGFGAGMGLPSIRRAADAFAIDSAPGRGTRLRFTVYLGARCPAAAGEGVRFRGTRIMLSQRRESMAPRRPGQGGPCRLPSGPPRGSAGSDAPGG